MFFENNAGTRAVLDSLITIDESSTIIAPVSIDLGFNLEVGAKLSSIKKQHLLMAEK